MQIGYFHSNIKPLYAKEVKNLLINPNPSDVNQRGFGGDWSVLAVGDYGYDRWAKASANTIAQMVEEGHYEPNTIHTLSGVGVETTQIVSPSNGHWKIEVPNDAQNIVLNEGEFALLFSRPDKTENRNKCLRYHWSVPGGMHSMPWDRSDVGRWCHVDVRFPVEMRINPTATYETLTSWDGVPNIVVYDNKAGSVTGNATTVAGAIVDGLKYDAEIPLT